MRTGRPPKLTPEVLLSVVESVGRGATIGAAAAACGVHPATVFEWQAKGKRQETGLYRDFADALTRARGTASVAVWGALYQAAVEDRDTKAIALWLDRTSRGTDALAGDGETEIRHDARSLSEALALLDEAESRAEQTVEA